MLSAAEQQRLDQIAAFAGTALAKAAPDWAMGAAPGPEIHAQAAGIGLTSLEVPVGSGGLGFGYALKVRAGEALAAFDFGFAMSVINTQNVALRLAQSATPDVAGKYLPRLLQGRSTACTALTEPGFGSDIAAMETTARRTSHGWIISGQKTWIINARHAELAIVYAQCSKPGDRSGIGAFLVDLTVSQCRRYPLDSPFSQTSMATGGFVLDACEVPDANLLLAPGTAFKAILSEINGARTYVAAMCCGMVAQALAVTQAYGRRRMTFGRPLEQHQVWRLGVADVAADLAAAQALVDKAVQANLDQTDAEPLSAAAKLHAVAMCQRHLPSLLHAMGAEGLKPEHPFARHIAASHQAALTDGSTAMLRERLARHTLSSTSR